MSKELKSLSVGDIVVSMKNISGDKYSGSDEEHDTEIGLLCHEGQWLVVRHINLERKDSPYLVSRFKMLRSGLLRRIQPIGDSFYVSRDSIEHWEEVL